MNHQDWVKNLNKILNLFSIQKPKNYSIYIEAFTHTSYANDHHLHYNYERLEFLGDSAIQWIIINFLYGIKPKLSEGNMTIMKANLVKRETLVNQAKKLGLDKLVFLGRSLQQKNSIPDSILEDIFEAFIGAIAQDQGIKKVSYILNKTIINDFNNNLISIKKDEKTILQEIIQTSSECKLEYQHNKNKDKWITNLYLIFPDNEKLLLSTGSGINTNQSDKEAANNALKKNIFKN